MSRETIERTLEFHRAALTCMYDAHPSATVRSVCAQRFARESAEHASGISSLLAADQSTPAVALLRPQFESLVLGVWLFHTADEKWAHMYCNPPPKWPSSTADVAPGMGMMLDSLSASDNGSMGNLIRNLLGYRILNWPALQRPASLGDRSSSCDEKISNFNVSFIFNVNGLVCLALQLAALASSRDDIFHAVSQVHNEFLDCITPLRN